MKQLAQEFTGIGEVRGFKFTQLRKTNKAFLYEVKTGDQIHYEVFKRVVNKRFACESYPKSKAFGISAFSIMDIGKALKKFNELNSFD